jgi:hypothetical protein
VQHWRRRVGSPAGSIVDEVFQAAGGGNNNIHALSQRGSLRGLGDAPVRAQRAQPRRLACLFQHRRYLLRQLARRRQNQRARALACNVTVFTSYVNVFSLRTAAKPMEYGY